MTDYFYIQSQLNQLVLTIDGFKNGGDLVMYPAYGGANQLWKFKPDGTLVNKMGLVADIYGSNQAQGTHCIGYYPTGSANQKWKYDDCTAVTVITSTMNGLVLDIAKGDKKISAFVQMWEKNGGLNQNWSLISPNKIQDD